MVVDEHRLLAFFLLINKREIYSKARNPTFLWQQSSEQDGTNQSRKNNDVKPIPPWLVGHANATGKGEQAAGG